MVFGPVLPIARASAATSCFCFMTFLLLAPALRQSLMASYMNARIPAGAVTIQTSTACPGTKLVPTRTATVTSIEPVKKMAPVRSRNFDQGSS